MKKLFFLKKINTKKTEMFYEKNDLNDLYLLLMIILFIGLTLTLIIRLFQLTIVKGNYYRNLAENNRLREFIIEPERGKIIDRKGFEIVKNLPANIETKVNEILKNKNRIISKRDYTDGLSIGHLIGYLQEANNDDLKNDQCYTKLKPVDKVGKKGVEKLFDCQLRGINGKKIIETDALGEYLETIKVIKATSGKTIQLAIDFKLQKKAYQLLEEKKGTVIVSNPKTGEILTLVSSPSFDPQDFFDNNTNKINQYLIDKNKPLFNRALEGVYPPGSLFKLITATAALEEKIIDEKTEYEDKGIIKAGPLTFGNWYFLQYGKTDGMVNVIKAIKRSNDIFFYLIGDKLGVEKIKKWAEIFGLGEKTGIELSEENGLIPSKFWKEKVLKENWYTGDSYNLSIGQGYLLTTPIQNLIMTNIFANDGYRCPPKLTKKQSGEKISCQKLPISKKTLEIVKEGMRQACDIGGTGWPFFNFQVKVLENNQEVLKKINVGCKTGTAESQSKDSLPHAWFTAFAPFEAPEISIVVLVENGGQGSDIAAPIAKEIFKEYFERKE